MIVLVMIMLVVLVIVVQLLYKIVNREKYLGKLLFKVQVPKSKGSIYTKPNLIFWIFMCCMWAYLLILQLMNMNRYPYRSPNSNLILSVFWIIASFTNILGLIYDKEIRENGILIRQDALYRSNLVYWKDIRSYKWIHNQKLELTFEFMSFFNYEEKTTKVWIIQEEDKEKIDTILNNYLDESLKIN